MVTWKVILSRQASKDLKKIKQAGLAPRTRKLLDQLQHDPFVPRFEKLVGDLKDFYSRRINIQHRLVYQVIEKDKIVKILRMWTHYE